MTTSARELLDKVLSAIERRIDVASGDLETVDEDLKKRADMVISFLEGSTAPAETAPPSPTGSDSPPATTDTAPPAADVASPTAGTPVGDPKDAELAALREATGAPETTTAVAPPATS